jgi:hypothetical protein
MQEPIASAKTPSGRRRARLLAGTLALTMVSFGAAVAITAAPAWASVPTNDYTIGTPGSAFTSVSVTPTAATSAQPQAYVITATAPSAIPNGDSITVTDSDGNHVASTALSTTGPVSLVDANAANCLQSGTNGGTATIGGGLVIILDTSCNIAAGDTIKIGLTVNDPLSNFSFSVASTVNGSTVASNTVTINAIPPTIAASEVTVGGGALYTISGLGTTPAGSANGVPWTAANLTEPPTTGTTYSISQLVVTSELTGSATVPSADNSIVWYNGASGYSVTYTPSGESLTTGTVSSALISSSSTIVGATDNVVTIDVGAIPAGANVTLTAEGVNPFDAGTYPVSILPEYLVPGTTTPYLPFTGDAETGSITIGTSISGLTVTPSPTLASTSATYTVGFKATSGVPGGDDICISEGSTSFANAFPSVTPDTSATLEALVTDTTSGTQYVVPVGDVGDVTCGSAITSANLDTNDLEITTPATQTITAGDQVTVTIINVANPTTVGTYSDFAVSTSLDSVAVDAPAYQIGVSSNVGISVAVSPVTPGALATYTISNLHASAATLSGATLKITPSGTGTVLPDNAGDYTLTDSTTTTGSGGLGGLVYIPATTTAPASVTLTVPNAINSGDQLTVTIDDVLNPPSAGSYYLTLGGTASIAGPAVTAPVFPEANTAYPDAGLVNFSGTVYLFAGGHAFGIPTPTVLTAVQVNDHATVVSAPTGATVPNTVPAVGTVVFTYNNPTIYVIGTDGDLHGFATPAQFLGDGYDSADVITVPNLNGLTVGATAGSEGTAVTALATSANGAIVDSSGTYYVFAGGKAFGIPTPARLAAVQAGDTATPLSGTVSSAQTGATIRNGTVVTLNSAVWVADTGALYAFKSVAQLQADGYGGTPSIVIPNVGGLSAVSTYTGS